MWKLASQLKWIKAHWSGADKCMAGWSSHPSTRHTLLTGIVHMKTMAPTFSLEWNVETQTLCMLIQSLFGVQRYFYSDAIRLSFIHSNGCNGRVKNHSMRNSELILWWLHSTSKWCSWKEIFDISNVSFGTASHESEADERSACDIMKKKRARTERFACVLLTFYVGWFLLNCSYSFVTSHAHPTNSIYTTILDSSKNDGSEEKERVLKRARVCASSVCSVARVLNVRWLLVRFYVRWVLFNINSIVINDTAIYMFVFTFFRSFNSNSRDGERYIL